MNRFLAPEQDQQPFQIEPKRLCEVKTRRRSIAELFSMKTLQHWPLHLLVCAASKAGEPSRIRAQNDAPSRWPGQPLHAERIERRVRLDAVILNRARGEPDCRLVERSLRRPCSCPPCVQPAKNASRDVVLAQRQQGLCALPSLTRALNGQGPERPRRVGEDRLPRRGTISDSSTGFEWGGTEICRCAPVRPRVRRDKDQLDDDIFAEVGLLQCSRFKTQGD